MKQHPISISVAQWKDRAMLCCQQQELTGAVDLHIPLLARSTWKT